MQRPSGTLNCTAQTSRRALAEESDGLQLRGSFTDVERLVQQNAALVEEAAASAASLNDQAERMNELASAFRLA